jgi:hypothetical protein
MYVRVVFEKMTSEGSDLSEKILRLMWLIVFVYFPCLNRQQRNWKQTPQYGRSVHLLFYKQWCTANAKEFRDLCMPTKGKPSVKWRNAGILLQTLP